MLFSSKFAFGVKKAKGVPELLASTFLHEMLQTGVPMEKAEHVECAVQAGILAERHKDVHASKLPEVLGDELDPRTFLARFQNDFQVR